MVDMDEKNTCVYLTVAYIILSLKSSLVQEKDTYTPCIINRMDADNVGPLLLTWFDFNPSMNK